MEILVISNIRFHIEFLGEGRNRNHQGLACAIIKLWEKSLVAKIAVKRGIQNTNNKLMAEEVKVSSIWVLVNSSYVYTHIYIFICFCPETIFEIKS